MHVPFLRHRKQPVYNPKACFQYFGFTHCDLTEKITGHIKGHNKFAWQPKFSFIFVNIRHKRLYRQNIKRRSRYAKNLVRPYVIKRYITAAIM